MESMGSITKKIKCIVWDLDNTIWTGILSEDMNVLLKPDIENIIKELDKRGILHSIASKNNISDAVNKLKAFGLYEYFLYPEINWNTKSSSIRNISDNINIGIDTILFIDDQQYEIDEVKNTLPEITCINADEYKSLLCDPRLDPVFITEDSKRRRSMYFEDINRKKDETQYEGPAEKYLMSLNMKLIISEAQEEDLKRAEELTVRTNQLNATGLTYSYDELNEFRKSNSHKLYICELVDKYGSYGKIGLALIEIQEHWHLKLLLMSCRVISRGIGTVLLSFIMKNAKEHNDMMYADFKMTDRNRQMYIAYKFSNFVEKQIIDSKYILFKNNLLHIHEYPPYIKVVIPKIKMDRQAKLKVKK